MSRRRIKKLPYAGLPGLRGQFVKRVHELARERGHRGVFEDFLELAFCAVAKTSRVMGDDRREALEERYMRLVGARPAEYIRAMPELLGMLSMGVSERCDFLGLVSGDLGALSEHAGQFFTPYEVSSLIARMTIDADVVRAAIASKGYVTVSEPASGAGGMLLAVADVIEDLGFDPHLHMVATAVDVSVLAFQMTYLQLSARGIPASVIHGNALSLETFESEVTPALAWLTFDHYLTERLSELPSRSAPDLKAPADVTIRGEQLELFGRAGGWAATT